LYLIYIATYSIHRCPYLPLKKNKFPVDPCLYSTNQNHSKAQSHRKATIANPKLRPYATKAHINQALFIINPQPPHHHNRPLRTATQVGNKMLPPQTRTLLRALTKSKSNLYTHSSTSTLAGIPSQQHRYKSTTSVPDVSNSTSTTSRVSGPVTTNDPHPREPVQNVSGTNEIPVSLQGVKDGSISESVSAGEEKRAMQAPNRASTWSRSQMPRERAMVGPRFEQTIMEMQVSLFIFLYIILPLEGEG
jgi:hypothetical protein